MKKQKQWNSKLVDSNQRPSFLELGKKLLNKSKHGNAEEVLHLISKGAPFATDWVGTSPLHWAAFYNHVEVAETLLLAGICKDAKNKVNRTPLHVAAQKGHHKIIQSLLNFGADVNCKDLLKMTPLHWAAESGSKETVQLLLDYGADITHQSVFDKTALMIAKDSNHYEIYKLIQDTSALEPSLRAVKLRVLRQKVKLPSNTPKQAVDIPTSPNFSALRLQVVPKTQKIGVLVDKENPITGERTLELIKNSISTPINNHIIDNPDLLRSHAIIFDSKNGPISTLPTVSNGQACGGLVSAPQILPNNSNVIRSSNIKVISEAKLGIPELKLSVDGKLNSGVNKKDIIVNKLPISNTTKNLEINNTNAHTTIETGAVTTNVDIATATNKPSSGSSKKIITVKADELINMTKDKKVIITYTRPISNARFFEGKLYTEEQKDELAQKVNARLQEAKIKAETLIKQLKKVNGEIDKYNKLLGSLYKRDPVH